MGAEIAFIYALSGCDIVLCDKTAMALSGAKERLASIYEKGASRSIYAPDQKSAGLNKIRTTTDVGEFSQCDVVVEAVFEQQDVKAEILTALDKVCRPDCIFATNTSTIPISVLASFVSPVRIPYFIGTHYFSPVSRMKLVEVIPGVETRDGAAHRRQPQLEEAGVGLVAAAGRPAFRRR